MTIENYYKIELAKENPDQSILSKLSKILERGTLTLNEWKLLGKFIPKSEFLAENPNVSLLKTCSEVIQYIGGHYIQVLKSGTFRYNSSIKGKVLDDVEDKIWREIAEKLWCEEC